MIDDTDITIIVLSGTEYARVRVKYSNIYERSKYIILGTYKYCLPCELNILPMLYVTLYVFTHTMHILAYTNIFTAIFI